MNGFLESILSSLRTAVVVVDQQSHVLTWNRQAEEFWGLRSEEVKGRPFDNLDIGLPVSVIGLIRSCVSGGGGGDGDYKEKILTALNRRGRQFTCRVACTPLLDGKFSKLGAILMMEERSPDGMHVTERRS